MLALWNNNFNTHTAYSVYVCLSLPTCLLPPSLFFLSHILCISLFFSTPYLSFLLPFHFCSFTFPLFISLPFSLHLTYSLFLSHFFSPSLPFFFISPSLPPTSYQFMLFLVHTSSITPFSTSTNIFLFLSCDTSSPLHFSSFTSLFLSFRNVREMSDLGKSLEWPIPPQVLTQFISYLQVIHGRYSGGRVVVRF